jgi:predicted dehydrogenase
MKQAAIIGISSYARNHLMIALEQALHGRLRLVAATVVNQDAEAFLCQRLRRLGCEVFASADEMWATFTGRVDLCFIPTGIHLHAAMTLQALRAGANVLVEKPLATSTADAAAIMQLEQATGRFVAVGFQDLYAESTWAIKRLLLSGGLGEVRSISFTGLWPRPISYYTRNEWAGRLSQGGRPVLDSPVSNAFAHFVNLALFWAGPALDTSAHATRLASELYRAQPIESFDTCCVQAALSTGPQLHFYVTHSCRDERVPAVTIEGSRGRIEWVQESHYDLVAANGTRRRHAVPGKFETKLMMSDAVLARFDDPTAQICSTAIALEHLRFVEAMHAASSIVDVASDHVRHLHASGDDWRQIVGIEQAIEQAHAARVLWSQLDSPWSKGSEPTLATNGHAGNGSRDERALR